MNGTVAIFVLAQVGIVATLVVLGNGRRGRSRSLRSPPAFLVDRRAGEADPLRAVQAGWTVALTGLITAAVLGRPGGELTIPPSLLLALGMTSVVLVIARVVSGLGPDGRAAAPQGSPAWSQFIRPRGGRGADVGRVLVLVTGLLAAAAYEGSAVTWIRAARRQSVLPEVPGPVLAVLLFSLVLFLAPRAMRRAGRKAGEPPDAGRTRPGWWWVPLVVVYVAALRAGAAGMLTHGAVGAQPQWRAYWLLSLLALDAVVITGTGWHRNWALFGRAAPRRTRRRVLIGAVATLIVLTETFAAATAATYTFGFTRATPALVTAADYRKLEGFYGWHLLDSIPQLDAADTLQLHRHVRLPGLANGFLLLAYKALVLVPVIAAVVWLVKGDERDTGP